MTENILDIEKNIDGIKRNLEKGTYIIKAGHHVAKTNPDGVSMELPLTEKMIMQRNIKLEEQLTALKLKRSS